MTKRTDLHHIIDRKLSDKEVEVIAISLIELFNELDKMKGFDKEKYDYSFLKCHNETEVIVWNVRVKHCEIIINFLNDMIRKNTYFFNKSQK